MLKMRTHCRKLASLVEHHEARANSAENSLKLYQQRNKKAAAAASRLNEEYVEYIRVPRRGNTQLMPVLSTIQDTCTQSSHPRVSQLPSAAGWV